MFREAMRVRKDLFASAVLGEHLTVAFGIHHRDWFSMDVPRHVPEAIASPRGSAKTTYFSFVDVLHAICFHTEEFIIIISESKSLAVERVMDIKSEIEGNDGIREFFGNLVGDVWKQDDLVCANGVRVVAKGRGGQIRGSKHKANRPSLIILDDVESSESVLSPIQREKIRQWYETDVRRAGRMDNDTKFRIVGTYLHPDALLPSLVEHNPGYVGKKYKAVLSWSNREDLWTEWREIYTNLTNPKRFEDAETFYQVNHDAMMSGVEMLWKGISYETIQKALITEGKSAVLKEYQNELDAGQFIFDMDNAVRFSASADGLLRSDGRLCKQEDILGASLFLDWAGGKDTLDNCYACAVLCVWERVPLSNHCYVYLADVWLDRVPLSKQIAACFDLYQKWSLLHVRFSIEDFPKDITGAIHDNVKRQFAEEKQRRANVGDASDLVLSFLPRNTEKIERITTKLEPMIANGWLAFNETLPRTFLEQFEQFPTHQFLDAPDATEGACQIKPVPKEPKRIIDRWERAEMEHENKVRL